MHLHPRFLKRYAQAVCALSVVMVLLFGSIAAFGMWHITYPAVKTLDKFTYETATSGNVLFGIKDENKHIFIGITKEQFAEKKPYYFNIARLDYPQRIRQVTLQMFVYALLFSMVFVIHRRLWKRLRGLGV